MASREVNLRCARCERKAPPIDSPEFRAWEGGGDLAGIDFRDETAAQLLVCPECREEEKSGAEIGGEA